MEAELCCVCLDVLVVAGKSLFISSCGHSFHAACVIKASRHGHTNCPLCRKQIDEFTTLCPQTRGGNIFFQEVRALSLSDAIVPVPLVGADWAVRRVFQTEASRVSLRAIPSVRAAQPNVPFDVLFEVNTVNPSNRRTPTDWVVLADSSGSMRGPKFDALLLTLHWMVDNMSRNDRMCLISFHTSASVLCGFVSGEDAGKLLLHELLTALEPGGGTNVHAAVEKASMMLSRRLQRNPHASVLLISDGCTVARPTDSPVTGMLRRMKHMATFNAVVLARNVPTNSEMHGYAASCRGACTAVQRPDELQRVVAALVGAASYALVRNLRVTVQGRSATFDAGTRVEGVYAGAPRYVGPYTFVCDDEGFYGNVGVSYERLPGDLNHHVVDPGPTYEHNDLVLKLPLGDSPAALEDTLLICNHRNRKSVVHALKSAYFAATMGGTSSAVDVLEGEIERLNGSIATNNAFTRVLKQDVSVALSAVKTVGGFEASGADFAHAIYSHEHQRACGLSETRDALYATASVMNLIV